MSDIPLIEEVVVVGREGEKKGDVDIVAIVVPNQEECANAGLTDEEAIYNAVYEKITEVNKKLVAYKHIGKLEIRNEPFEKTAAKKIKRFLVK